MVLITVTNRWQFPQRFGRIYITKNTVMTLRRMAAGMRESGENPEHLTGAVSAAGRHSGRKSVSEEFLEKANGRQVLPTVRARRPMIGI